MRRLFVIIILCLIFGSSVSAGDDQLRRGIPALKANEEYASLLEQEKNLQSSVVSLQLQIDKLRAVLRENPGSQRQYADQILSMESEMLSLQSRRNQIGSRITAIEQAWLADHPDYVESATENRDESVIRTPAREQKSNLVYNPCFEEYLEPSDYRALLEAQQAESTMAELAARIVADYGIQSEFKMRYDTVRTEQAASELLASYRAAESTMAELQDSLSRLWNESYDNKTYAYNYVLDRLSREDLLIAQEKSMEKARQRVVAAQRENLLEALSDYCIRKRQLISFEQEMARLLGLTQAADSLQRVAQSLQQVDYRLPRLELIERYFLDYEPLEFTTTRRYSSRNPIPDCPVYEHGVMYRLLLGEYKYKQDPSIFRNAVPLYVQRTPESRYRYFVGGFATKAEAVEAQEVARKRGFRNPVIVVWYDGRYVDLSVMPEEGAAAYKIQITGASALSASVRETVGRMAPGVELSRVGQDFIVGRFDDETQAEQVAEAIRSVDGKLTVKVMQIVD